MVTNEKRMGRPSKYDPKLHPQLVKWMARAGLTDKEMAAQLQVSVTTFNSWKAQHPEFLESQKQSKDFVDSLVEDALLKRALGYEVEETEMSAGTDGKSKRVKKVRRHISPDVTACIFWLKNRRPGQFRDVHALEHGGPGGGPILVTLEELQQRYAASHRDER